METTALGIRNRNREQKRAIVTFFLCIKGLRNAGADFRFETILIAMEIESNVNCLVKAHLAAVFARLSPSHAAQAKATPNAERRPCWNAKVWP